MSVRSVPVYTRYLHTPIIETCLEHIVFSADSEYCRSFFKKIMGISLSDRITGCLVRDLRGCLDECQILLPL